jgi:putative hydroxymethylpyrimidine transport system substrate-binding protein
MDPPTGRTQPLTRRLVIVALALAALGLAACGERTEPTAAPGQQRVTLLLDWLPNADHAPIYAAQQIGAFKRAGLDVRIQVPSDATSPLKLLAAGRVDLAITYEPELLISRDKGQQLVAVGALAQKPLSSIISLRGKVKDPRDLAGKSVGITGLPSDDAALKAVLDHAGVPVNRVKTVNVGFNLVPSLLSKKVDAILGAYWNIEAVELARAHKDPSVIRIDQAGVPTYNELVFAARKDYLGEQGEVVRRLMQALSRGAQAMRNDPALAADALVAANKDLKRDDQLAMVRKSMPVYFPPAGKPYGWMEPLEWQQYGDWMYKSKLIAHPLNASRASTNEFLPGQGLADSSSG